MIELIDKLPAKPYTSSEEAVVEVERILKQKAN